MQNENICFPAGLEPGMYFGLGEEEYFSDPAINSSLMKHAISGCPYDFWVESPWNPNKPKKKQSDEMLFGKVLHKLLFEEESFDDEFIVMPGQKAYSDKRMVIYQNQYAKAHKMRKRLLESNPTIKALLSGEGYPEVSVFWRDEDTGIMLKARHDFFKVYCSADFKTVYSVRDKDLRRIMHERVYHLQGFHYLESRKQIRRLFIDLIKSGREIHDLPIYGQFSDWGFIQKFMDHDKDDAFFNVVQSTSNDLSLGDNSIYSFPSRFWMLDEDTLRDASAMHQEAMMCILHYTAKFGTDTPWQMTTGELEVFSSRYGFTRNN